MIHFITNPISKRAVQELIELEEYANTVAAASGVDWNVACKSRARYIRLCAGTR